jgi:hypothetical protein
VARYLVALVFKKYPASFHSPASNAMMTFYSAVIDEKCVWKMTP